MLPLVLCMGLLPAPDLPAHLPGESVYYCSHDNETTFSVVDARVIRVRPYSRFCSIVLATQHNEEPGLAPNTSILSLRRCEQRLKEIARHNRSVKP